jgi:hypothetical protein
MNPLVDQGALEGASTTDHTHHAWRPTEAPSPNIKQKAPLATTHARGAFGNKRVAERSNREGAWDQPPALIHRFYQLFMELRLKDR